MDPIEVYRADYSAVPPLAEVLPVACTSKSELTPSYAALRLMGHRT